MQRSWLGIVAAIGVLLSAVPVAWAGNGEHGHYLGFRIVGAYSEVQDTAATGFTGALQVNNDTDLTAGAGAVLGYRWKSLPIRTEIEIAYRFRFDHDLRDTGAPVQGYENNLATLSGLVNVAYEFRNNSDFTPYLGGSIGWAQHHSQVDRDNLTTGDEEAYENRKHNFAWGALAGVTWRFAKRWDADLGYRFANLGEVDSGKSSIGTQFTADDYISHDVLVTVNYRF